MSRPPRRVSAVAYPGIPHANVLLEEQSSERALAALSHDHKHALGTGTIATGGVGFQDFGGLPTLAGDLLLAGFDGAVEGRAVRFRNPVAQGDHAPQHGAAIVGCILFKHLRNDLPDLGRIVQQPAKRGLAQRRCILLCHQARDQHRAHIRW